MACIGACKNATQSTPTQLILAMSQRVRTPSWSRKRSAEPAATSKFCSLNRLAKSTPSSAGAVETTEEGRLSNFALRRSALAANTAKPLSAKFCQAKCGLGRVSGSTNNVGIDAAMNLVSGGSDGLFSASALKPSSQVVEVKLPVTNSITRCSALSLAYGVPAKKQCRSPETITTLSSLASSLSNAARSLGKPSQSSAEMLSFWRSVAGAIVTGVRSMCRDIRQTSLPQTLNVRVEAFIVSKNQARCSAPISRSLAPLLAWKRALASALNGRKAIT